MITVPSEQLSDGNPGTFQSDGGGSLVSPATIAPRTSGLSGISGGISGVSDMAAIQLPTGSREYTEAELNKIAEMQSKIGTSMQVIGGKMQNDLNEAIAKSAVTSFISKANDILYGENGYISTQGINAHESAQPALEALSSAAGEIADSSLNNDSQKLMYQSSVNQHLSQMKEKILTHRYEQVKKYTTGEAIASQNAYIQTAINSYDSYDQKDNTGAPSGMYNASLITAFNEGQKAADIQGLPADSFQRQAIQQKIMGNIATGVVGRLQNDGRYFEAKAYLDPLVKNGAIDEQTAEELSKGVKSNYDKYTALNIADKVYNGIPVGGKPGENDYRKALVTLIPGIKVTSIERTNEQQRALITSGATSAENSYHIPGSHGDGFQGVDVAPVPNMTLTTFVKTLRSNGVQVIQAIDESKEGGTGPHWHIAMKLPDSMVSNHGGIVVSKGPGGVPDLGVMESAVRKLSLPVEQEQLTLTDIRQRYNDGMKVKDDRYNSVLEYAQGVAYKSPGGWRNVPPAVWSGLKQQDRAKLMEMPKGDDTDALLKLQMNPDLWKNGQIQKFRGLISEDTYKKYYTLGNGTDGDSKVLTAKYDNNSFQDALNKAGLGKMLIAKKGTDQQVELVDLHKKFTDSIIAEQTAQGKELTLDQKDKILKQLISPVKVKAVSKFFGWQSDGTLDKRVYEVQNPRNIVIPTEMKNRIISDFKQRGIQYNDTTVLGAYLKLQGQ